MATKEGTAKEEQLGEGNDNRNESVVGESDRRKEQREGSWSGKQGT